MFNKILVANRGEIAVRIIETAKALGYRTLAVFSDADSQAPHVLMADEAVYIGASSVSDSYLNSDKLLAAARASGADAVHPGYGFLSENAQFAQSCQDAGLVFIGPGSSAIALMGSKAESKRAMIAAGVPCIPGYEGEAQDTDTFIVEADNIGFPLMIKASNGGGGRGMQLVNQMSELSDGLKSARSESLAAFGSEVLILEKALFGCRHIEIQIIADTQGNTVYLAERDCSVQRRHQKVIEEAPSLSVSPQLREKLGQTAVLAAKACQYVGAGTVEFLLEPSGEFYFLEMNTRLQVEHPVTELITGLDLVALQLSVANGEPLPFTQEQVTIKGHAIEVRLYAEDPANGFMPQSGEVLLWRPANLDEQTGLPLAGLRVDSGISEGGTVTAFYDPMLAKFIAYGDNREQARRRLLRLVQESHLLGLRDNRAFLSQLLQHKIFIQGEACTHFVADEFMGDVSLTEQVVTEEELILAAVLMNVGRDKSDIKRVSEGQDFNSSYLGDRFVKFAIAEREYTLSVARLDVRGQGTGLSSAKTAYTVTKRVDSARDEQLSEPSESLTVLELTQSNVRYEYQGVIKRRYFVFSHQKSSPSLWLTSDMGNLEFIDLTLSSKSLQTYGSDRVLAPMDGVVVEVNVAVGDEIKTGDLVGVIEAMKMEHSLKASVDGRVECINVSAGDQVKGRQLIIQLATHES
ncbi:ATP-grasp domain-containing protein [Shewanella sp. D64]|uniref:acetyl/propionyl/methylcrotonyl-CoA carboxylase subunit alpha n=1 Tax=unclassified Shewanella TaxID=196818 RepID=UPI0022BA60C4|nr:MULTISPECIES: biotin carboxylase N-terminal domain-containing protein [unclassified Shewanella]MEC4724713.1 ATP-grasp domain-containing protein [Shewanella sp. D64]MEC4736493.1 ATP-grasp domain-containing protein [Shewanella sp. E94]WBJ97452.1 ATP-grasp domain-containing protein [Shewanella sp. MTB7]